MSRNSRKCLVCGKSEYGTSYARAFYTSFPLDENRCREWLRLVGDPELVFLPIEKLNRIKFICGDHFAKKDFNKEGNRLKKTAVPTCGLKRTPLTKEQLKEFPMHMWNYKKEYNTFRDHDYCQHQYEENVSGDNDEMLLVGTTDPPRTLHVFPNPIKDAERFNTWVLSIGGDIVGLPNEFIHKYRRVCRAHFEEKFWCRFNKLNNLAVPTLNLPGPKALPKFSLTSTPLKKIKTTQDLVPSTENIPATSKVTKNVRREHDYLDSKTKHEDHTYAKTDETKENEPPQDKIFTITDSLTFETDEQESQTDNHTDEVDNIYDDHEIYTHQVDIPGAHEAKGILYKYNKIRSQDRLKEALPKYYILEQFEFESNKSKANEVDRHKSKPEVSRPVLHHVGFLKQKLRSMLYSHQFCTLCFESDKPLKPFHEQIVIITDNWTQTVRLKQLYNYVFNQNAEQSASECICTDCSEQLKQSYIFIKYSKLTTKLLESYINDLQTKTFDEAITEKGPTEENNAHGIHLESDQVYKYFNKQNGQNYDNDQEIITEEIESTDNFKIISLRIPKRKVTKKVRSKPAVKTKPACEICSKTFNNNFTLSNHYMVAHRKVRCEICSSLVDEGDINQHLTTEHKDKVHFCEICNLPFYRRESVTVHTKVVHVNDNFDGCVLCYGQLGDHDKHASCPECNDMACIHKKYLDAFVEQKLNYATAKVKCPYCDYSCKQKDGLIRHANKEHLNHCPHICDQCGQQFYDKPSLVQHIQVYHSSVLYCSYCDCVCSSDGALAAHEADCSATTRAHCCQYCAASFHTFKLLQKHHNTRHKETFPCNFCNKLFQTEYQRKRHTFLIHSGVKRKIMHKKLVCKMCHDVFDLRSELTHHMKIHQGPDAKYNCKPCDTEFESLETLKSHNKTKHGDATSVCNICGRNVKESLLEKHLEEHKMDAEVNCDECGRSFTNINRLKVHIRKRHVHTMKCKLCNYGTVTSAGLETHMNRVHKKIKPYVCHLCGQQFYGKTSLTKHTAVCQNKPRCATCGKEFTTVANLRKHSYIHTGVKQFACKICGDKFRSTDSRNVHILKKHAEKSMSCPNCPKKFLTMVNLRVHIEKHH